MKFIFDYLKTVFSIKNTIRGIVLYIAIAYLIYKCEGKGTDFFILRPFVSFSSHFLCSYFLGETISLIFFRKLLIHACFSSIISYGLWLFSELTTPIPMKVIDHIPKGEILPDTSYGQASGSQSSAKVVESCRQRYINSSSLEKAKYAKDLKEALENSKSLVSLSHQHLGTMCAIPACFISNFQPITKDNLPHVTTLFRNQSEMTRVLSAVDQAITQQNRSAMSIGGSIIK